MYRPSLVKLYVLFSTQALEYLKLMVQFKDFGFQDEKLFEALKKSECDSNKALDILTCAG